MANPIIKIKSSTTSFPPEYNEITGAGLTFSELGARITPNIYGLYIGSTGTAAIRIGSEIADDSTLGSPGGGSPYKIPTQRSIRNYVNNSISSINNTSPFVISRYSSGVGFLVGGDKEKIVNFENLDFAIGSVNLVYLNGTFTNNGETALKINIIYQIMWRQSASSPLNTNQLNRSQWIETSTGGKYAFTTCVMTPVTDLQDEDVDTCVNASCILSLGPGEFFTVKAYNHSGSTTNIIGSNGLIPSKATLIQISGI